MSEVAYGERKQNEIQKRKNLNTLYTIAKRFSKIFMTEKYVESILVYPKITTNEKLENIVNKISWAFPYSENLTVFIAVDNLLDTEEISFKSILSDQEIYYDKNRTNIEFILSEEIDGYLNSDMILLFDTNHIFDIKLLFRFQKLEIMDENYFSVVESKVLQTYFYKTLSSEKLDYYKNISKKNILKLEEKYKDTKKSYCFVTGPSFDRYNEFDYEDDSFKIICNSTVKNDAFLDYIKKPDLLVFADPVFHFSPCKYSSTFREEVIKVHQKYGCFIGVPESTVPLLLAFYPELESSIIGIGGKISIKEKIFKIKEENFNFPTSKELWVKSSANILTLYMLPFASSFADEINIIGADGREKNEKYFWKHSASAQFDDLMKTVFTTHPSFFRDRDYEDYYDEHCDFLERQIQFGERNGKKYCSMTNSFIPALSKRECHDK